MAVSSIHGELFPIDAATPTTTTPTTSRTTTPTTTTPTPTSRTTTPTPTTTTTPTTTSRTTTTTTHKPSSTTTTDALMQQHHLALASQPNDAPPSSSCVSSNQSHHHSPQPQPLPQPPQPPPQPQPLLQPQQHPKHPQRDHQNLFASLLPPAALAPPSLGALPQPFQDLQHFNPLHLHPSLLARLIPDSPLPSAITSTLPPTPSLASCIASPAGPFAFDPPRTFASSSFTPDTPCTISTPDLALWNTTDQSFHHHRFEPAPSFNNPSNALVSPITGPVRFSIPASDLVALSPLVTHRHACNTNPDHSSLNNASAAVSAASAAAAMATTLSGAPILALDDLNVLAAMNGFSSFPDHQNLVSQVNNNINFDIDIFHDIAQNTFNFLSPQQSQNQQINGLFSQSQTHNSTHAHPQTPVFNQPQYSSVPPQRPLTAPLLPPNTSANIAARSDTHTPTTTASSSATPGTTNMNSPAPFASIQELRSAWMSLDRDPSLTQAALSTTQPSPQMLRTSMSNASLNPAEHVAPAIHRLTPAQILETQTQQDSRSQKQPNSRRAKPIQPVSRVNPPKHALLTNNAVQHPRQMSLDSNMSDASTPIDSASDTKSPSVFSVSSKASIRPSPALKPILPNSGAHSRIPDFSSLNTSLQRFVHSIVSDRSKKPMTPHLLLSQDMRKNTHKQAEQRRRDDLKQCFEEMRHVLPPMQDKAPSKITVMRAAYDHVIQLQNIVHRQSELINKFRDVVLQSGNGDLALALLQCEEVLGLAPCSGASAEASEVSTTDTNTCDHDGAKTDGVHDTAMIDDVHVDQLSTNPSSPFSASKEYPKFDTFASTVSSASSTSAVSSRSSVNDDDKDMSM